MVTRLVFSVVEALKQERERTEAWLSFYGVKDYEFLLMRRENDFRKDNIVKQEIYENHIKDKYNVLMIYDDRDQVVNMWRSLGLKVYQVNRGDF